MIKFLRYLLFLALCVSIFVFFAYQFGILSDKSLANSGKVSAETSLVISVPACVKAGGEEITRIYVYCLNSRGIGEANTVVDIQPSSRTEDLRIVSVQATTDDSGKAIFDLTSKTQGYFRLSVMCGDVRVRSDFKVCFSAS